MKRLALALLLLGASAAFGQGAFIPPQIALRTVNGITAPLSAATITVCPALAGGIPCAPVTVSIFKDAALTQPLSNPFTADAQGNYIFAVAQGTYTVTVTGAGFGGYSYQISVAAGAGAPIPAPGGGAAPPGYTFPTKFYYTIAEDTAVTNVVGGGNCFGTQALGSLPTATEPQGRLFTSTAVGSVNANAGCQVGFGANPGQGQTSPGLTARVSQRLMTQTTTSTRYWIGYTDGSSGTFGGSGFSTDTPNGNLCMFRHSDGTDVNWKAYCSTDSTHFTVVDTGVAVSTTASYIFEVGFTPSFAPTAANFYLNGNLVATISTNLPSASLAMGYAWIVDNKNTATATSTYFMWSQAIFNK
jgi:hypothetical protein